jgi:predicted RNase H-like HicB family nuclease
MIDAELYTISVRKELIENEFFYVARVAELPDVEEYGDSYDEARELAIETITTSYELCIEEKIPFPTPIEFSVLDSVSGRITLRMPKSLHAKLVSESEKEEVSLNQYLVSSLSMRYGQCQMSDDLLSELQSRFSNIKSEIHKYQKVAATYLFKEHLQSFGSKEQPKWEQKRESSVWAN